MIEISTNFEAGSIVVLSASDPADIVLKLKDDDSAAVCQWFYFRLSGARGHDVRMTFRNIDRNNANTGLGGMPILWEGYDVLASYDRERWFPVATRFQGGDLIVALKPDADTVYFANFVPYTSEREARLLAASLASPRAALERLGRTLEGRDLNCLRIGDPAANRKKCWIIARQHPAETQGTWCVEGIVERLLDERDRTVSALLERAVFYLVPNMNPDGSQRGYTRTNAHGVNLNREWASPSPERSPEVFVVKRRMEETGLHFGLDIHAWTGAHNFAVGPYNTPSVTERQTAIWRRYEAALAAASRDFETGWPYPGGGPDPGKADLSMSWNYFSEAYGAIGVLYELLYKANAGNRDSQGWTADKCKRFGHATIDAIARIVDEI